MPGEKLLSSPPLHSHGLTPSEIVGPEMLTVLARHFELLGRVHAENFDKAAKKVFGESDRAMIADAYARLREHGYYPGGMDGDRISWGIALKSKAQMRYEDLAREDGLDELPVENLQSIARWNFRKLAEMPGEES